MNSWFMVIIGEQRGQVDKACLINNNDFSHCPFQWYLPFATSSLIFTWWSTWSPVSATRPSWIRLWVLVVSLCQLWVVFMTFLNLIHSLYRSTSCTATTRWPTETIITVMPGKWIVEEGFLVYIFWLTTLQHLLLLNPINLLFGVLIDFIYLSLQLFWSLFLFSVKLLCFVLQCGDVIQLLVVGYPWLNLNVLLWPVSTINHTVAQTGGDCRC